MKHIFFCRLSDADKGAAEVGVTETTLEPTKYFLPKVNKVNLWELPGVGSPELPYISDYSRKMNLINYDAFIFLVAGRFRFLDKQLVELISKYPRKHFFIVSTKFNKDVESNSKISKNKEETKKEVIKDFRKNLGGLVTKN